MKVTTYMYTALILQVVSAQLSPQLDNKFPSSTCSVESNHLLHVYLLIYMPVCLHHLHVNSCNINVFRSVLYFLVDTQFYDHTDFGNDSLIVKGPDLRQIRMLVRRDLHLIIQHCYTCNR